MVLLYNHIGPGYDHPSLLPALGAVLAGATPGRVILLGILIPLGLAVLMSSSLWPAQPTRFRQPLPTTTREDPG